MAVVKCNGARDAVCFCFNSKRRTLIADVLLLIHFGLAALITNGFLIIPVGYKLAWNWIKKRILMCPTPRSES